MPSVLQQWVMDLPMMQQSVLLSCIRGPDGLVKGHPAKYLLRWLRRCTLLCSFDKRVHVTPSERCEGSFTGSPFPDIVRDSILFSATEAARPAREKAALDALLMEYLRVVDEVPHHFHMHLVHASEILGYKHPDEPISSWWLETYRKLVKDLHLHPETREELDLRLGDRVETWKARDVHEGKDHLLDSKAP